MPLSIDMCVNFFYLKNKIETTDIIVGHFFISSTFLCKNLNYSIFQNFTYLDHGSLMNNINDALIQKKIKLLKKCNLKIYKVWFKKYLPSSYASPSIQSIRSFKCFIYFLFYLLCLLISYKSLNYPPTLL